MSRIKNDVLYIVRVYDKRSGKAMDYPCEKERIYECMNWLADRLACNVSEYELREEDFCRSNGVPYGEVIDRARARKKNFDYAVFEGEEDRYCSDDVLYPPAEEEEVVDPFEGKESQKFEKKSDEA